MVRVSVRAGDPPRLVVSLDDTSGDLISSCPRSSHAYTEPICPRYPELRRVVHGQLGRICSYPVCQAFGPLVVAHIAQLAAGWTGLTDAMRGMIISRDERESGEGEEVG